MAEVWFYHLEQETADKVLPGLLQRGLERELRMAVQTLSLERVKEISQSLWAYEDIAFLAHGIPGEDNPEGQPIYVTASPENPNAASFRFYIDGASPDTLAGLDRACILFNGKDETAKQLARDMWKRFKGEGHDVKYWKQSEQGHWQDQAAATREET